MLPMETIGFRENLVLGHINRTAPVKQLCKIFSTTRKTIIKWVKRFRKWGRQGLEALSRAPKRVWNKVPGWVEHLVCSLYNCGIEPEDIHLGLKETYPVCEKTVYNILHRNRVFGRAKYEPIIRRYQYKQPNQLWHIDITKFRIKGEGRFYIIAVIDNCSRKILGIGVYKRQTAKNVVETFRQAVQTHGTPNAVLSDNGRQFISNLFRDFCESSSIKHRRTRPYNPKCNGKIERWFKSLKKELKLRWYNCKEELERAVNGFVREYNMKPKRVLKWRCPAEVHSQ